MSLPVDNREIRNGRFLPWDLPESDDERHERWMRDEARERDRYQDREEGEE
jgi:hypothetical protein